MLAGIISRARSVWRGARRRADVDTDMNEEFELHMTLRAADLVRSGLTPAEAARRAKLEFGSTEHYKDRGAESRGLKRFDGMRVSWLDFKLGFRMLARYPGLTLVGGVAMAFAIWIGAGVFELVTQVLRPTIPLPAGNSIVAIGIWDAAVSLTLCGVVSWNGVMMKPGATTLTRILSSANSRAALRVIECTAALAEA